MDTIDRINSLLSSLGKTGAEMSRDLGLSNSAYSQWNTRKTRPSKKILPAIAEYLGTTVPYLLGEETKNALSPEQQRILDQMLNSNMYTIYWDPHRLSNMREQHGESIQDIAKALNMDVEYYKTLEYSDTIPPISVLNKLANHFDTSIDRFLNRGDTALPEKHPISNDELKFALWGDCSDIDEDDLADVLKYAAFVRERKKQK